MLRIVIYSAVIFASAFNVSGCDSDGAIEVYYPTYMSAMMNGHPHEYIPMWWLPESAFEIHKKLAPYTYQGIQTYRGMLAYKFDGKAFEFSKRCERTVPFKLKEPPFKVSWWWGDIPASNLSGDSYIFYSCGTGDSFLAFSIQPPGNFYYWKP